MAGHSAAPPGASDPDKKRPAAQRLSAEELAEISRITIEHYDRKAEQFWEQTRDHDVEQNRAALLRHIDGPAPYRILDLGCAGGRDLAAFRALGHDAVGLEGSARLCELARRHSGCLVLHQDLLAMDLPREGFDGVFANAALFHVPTQELPRILRHLTDALKPRGVLFSSNPHGSNLEGWQDGRYRALHDATRWHELLGAAGLAELERFYRPPGLPRHLQPWLATVWRKTDGACCA